MNASTEERHPVQHDVGQGTSISGAFRLRIVAAIVGLAVLLAGGAQWSHRDAVTAQEAAPQQKAEAQAEPATVEYLPAQHVNQARDSEDHIQAF